MKIMFLDESGDHSLDRIKNKMKANYPTKKLGEVCEKFKIERAPVGTAPYVEIGDIDIGTKGISFKKKGAVKGSIFAPSNCVIISRVRPTRGAATLLKNKVAISSAFTILKPKPTIDVDFLFLFTAQNSGFFNYLGTKQKGSSYPSCRESDISNFEIPLPPLSEQKKIVAKLESVLAKISEAKKLRVEAQKNTNNLLSAELHKIFKEGKKKGWEEKELGEVFTLNYGKGLARSERSENGKYIVYGANGKLGRSDKYLIEGNGIIIGRKGSAGEIINVLGKYWPTDVTYFVTEDKNYDINFVYYLFKFLNFPQYAAGVKPGINRNQIYKIKISLPSLTEQKKIVARLDKLSQKIEKIKKLQATTQNELTILEQSILSKAFKGQL